MSINRVVISGNLTRDPEVRKTQGGMSVMKIGVAVNDRRRDPNTGNWEDYPNFIDCTMFGTRADAVSPYLHKGLKVAIEGKLRWSQWERDGQKRSKIEVIIDDIEFMSSRGNDGASYSGGYGNANAYGANTGYNAGVQGYSNQASQSNAAPTQPVKADTGVDASVYDDDIPF